MKHLLFAQLLLLVPVSLFAQFGGGGFGGFGGGMPQGGFYGGMQPFGQQNENEVEFQSSNLPIIIIETDGQRINSESKITATMKVIDYGGERNNVTDSANNYDGHIAIKLRGNSSLSFPQKRYTLETRLPDGKNNNVELLGLPKENDWVLLAPYNDVSMLRDVFAFNLWNEMGHWGSHTRYAELVLNGSYQGVYILTEKIKRDKNRLDIANLKKEDNSGLELTGGYIMRIDAYDQNDLTFVSKIPGLSTNGMGMGMPMGGFGGFGGGFGGAAGGMAQGGFGGGMNQVVWSYYLPDKDDITEAQKAYIKSYIDTVEQVIHSPEFADPNTGYAKYISVSSFVDYFIHTELSLNSDGFKRSAYFYKKKLNPDGTGGKLHAGPVWDFNLAFGNCTFCNGTNITAWVHEGGETSPTPAFWKRLTEDPAFMERVKARWAELRSGVLSIERINEFIDSNAAMLSEAEKRHFAKYDNLLVEQNQSSRAQQSNSPAHGMGGFGGFGMGMPQGGFGGFGGMMGGDDLWFAAYRVSSYEEEIATLKDWLARRIAFLDSQWR